MKFAIALTWIFLTFSTLVSAGVVTSKRSFADSCGGGEVTGNTTVDYNGGSIGYVTGSCPQAASKKRDGSKLEERQSYYELCTEGDCYVSCQDTSYYTIYPSDCAYVIEYLASYAYSTAYVYAGSYHEWYYGSCGVYFVNLDYYDYEVCYAEVAYDAEAAGEYCLGYTNGAVCTSSLLPGDAYQVIIESS